MMAGSTSALQSEAGYIDARPQIRQIDENLLRRTAGPYIRVNVVDSSTGRLGPLYPRSGRLRLRAALRKRAGNGPLPPIRVCLGTNGIAQIRARRGPRPEPANHLGLTGLFSSPSIARTSSTCPPLGASCRYFWSASTVPGGTTYLLR